MLGRDSTEVKKSPAFLRGFTVLACIALALPIFYALSVGPVVYVGNRFLDVSRFENPNNLLNVAKKQRR